MTPEVGIQGEVNCVIHHVSSNFIGVDEGMAHTHSRVFHSAAPEGLVLQIYSKQGS